MKRKIFFLILTLSLPGWVISQENRFTVDLNGQLIGWTNFNFSNGFRNQPGIRYIPEFMPGYRLADTWKLDADISLNSYAVTSFGDQSEDPQASVDLYRLWFRLSSDRYELRTGLQKINFGSASILRPLMWFDQIDPRDPLQLTTGVYGLLSRYYFLNNANLWFWVLYGNENLRGWDYLPADPEKPEVGGRVQFPAGPGELAFSFHHKTIAGDSLIFPPTGMYMAYEGFAQERFAIDGKWDLGIGLWFENSLKINREFLIPGQKYVNQLTMGMDYTFGLGNGLNLKAEHLFWLTGDDLLDDPQNINYSALSANYPITLFDQVSAIVYYNYEEKKWYRFINLSRQYDDFIFYLMAYWNPESFDIYKNADDISLFSGKGFQFMIVFNH